jgi:hypothetical protein
VAAGPLGPIRVVAFELDDRIAAAGAVAGATAIRGRMSDAVEIAVEAMARVVVVDDGTSALKIAMFGTDGHSYSAPVSPLYALGRGRAAGRGSPATARRCRPGPAAAGTGTAPDGLRRTAVLLRGAPAGKCRGHLRN